MDRFSRMSGMTMALLELAKIGLALAGVFLLMVHGSRAYEAYNSQFWPTAIGEITRSAIDASADFNGSRRYSSSIKYTYKVDQAVAQSEHGDTFIGQRIGIVPLPQVDSRAIAESRLEPYPKGASVQVYYNPNRQERSMLEPNFSLVFLLRPLLGLLCLGAAIGLWKVGKGRI